MPAGEVDLVKDVASEAWYAETPYDRIPDFPYDFGDGELKSLCRCRWPASCLSQFFVNRHADKGPHIFANSPLALQIVGLPWQEELCLLISKHIDDIIHSE